MRQHIPLTLCVILLAVAPCLAEPPRPSFYLPLDSTTTATIAAGAAGPIHNGTGPTDTILELLSLQGRQFAAGQVGQSFDLGDQPLVYECAGNFRPDEGTCSFWISPKWRGDDKAMYSAMFGAADWGMVYKYLDQSGLTFGTAKPTKDIYYDCGGGNLSSWLPGQWHHVAVTWSRQANQRRLYADGKLLATAPFPCSREVKTGPLFVGAGCTLYPAPIAHAKMDEFALWDKPLDEATIQEIHALGAAGKPLAEAPSAAAATSGDTGAIEVVHPQTPPPPAANAPQTTQTDTRTRVSLNGWWQFLPSATELAKLPATGWGLSRVPGYWTTRGDTLGPDGAVAAGTWAGQPLNRCWVACYQRSFTADQAWKSRRALLRVGGVDGLAAIYFNGKLLDWLPSWQPEGYDVTPLLRLGEENTVNIMLRTRGGSQIAGIYGDVCLDVTSEIVINDVTITPHVDKGQIEFSCGVLHTGQPADATLEFAIAAKSDPAKVLRHFSYPCKLQAVAEGTTVSSRLARINATFAWRDAHLWNIDDPFLYQVTVSVKSGGQLLDRTEPQRFGFREFEMRGADFYLNGKLVHLRGHQIDLAWADQWQRVLELKEAGLNSLELSGPIASDWYRGIPYHRQLFDDILNYCDEHGLIALPILPDLPVIKDRIFEPAVAALYRQRIEQYVRTYGNHPCIGMWYMNFNLAGYLWYCAPSKLDGTYQPDDPGWLRKERYALEGQRIVQSIDPRPIYHHACGNFGDLITSNLYLGPNSPTQEREEWPSAWAAKRPKPFMACEHCCMLICYWFRPRQFPLSVVYAGEPIFDEISAMYLGPQAYEQISPRLFDLYDVGKTPRGNRTQALINNHPGYQATKSLVAKYSLRSWRTYGVSGIIFNAENWDFKDDAGNKLPMMKAMARYFGDTDLYIAGPGADWPSKDHNFYAGETVRKQVVLLNDLAHDIPCTLQWRLSDATGKALLSGKIEAISKAGTPTFYPLEFKAPTVAQRTEFTLTVQPVKQPRQDFKPESFAIQVFAAAKPSAPTGTVLLYDPVGDTAKMLQKAGITYANLTPQSKLSFDALLVVGRKSYDAGFLALAKTLNLEQAIRQGLRLVVLEQTSGTPFGLKLEETSTRQTFISHDTLLGGLQEGGLWDLRGQSDLIEPYPDAPEWSKQKWPERCFKWGNRGVVATYVYDKPHYAPFRSILNCGFDLCQSPLLEAQFGKGQVTLCQVDVTPRYGIDPVSTRLVDALLRLAAPTPQVPCSYLGASARTFLAPYGMTPTEYQPGARGVIVVGKEPLEPAQLQALQRDAEAGATVLLLPGSPAADAFGLRLHEEKLFIANLPPDALLAGLNPGDLYLKSWETLPVASAENGWRNLVEPGLIAFKQAGMGRVVACQLDPDKLTGKRGRVKALRVWNMLLTNLGVERNSAFITAPAQAYEDNEWEKLPPYMSW